MYVDDVLDSCETPETAKSLRIQLTEVLKKGGFKLRKWASNNSSVVEDVPQEDRVQKVKIEDGDPSSLKTLGVWWKSDGDVFTFQVKQPEVRGKTTKRSVLRAIATSFDPLQFLSPFTLAWKNINATDLGSRTGLG